MDTVTPQINSIPTTNGLIALGTEFFSYGAVCVCVNILSPYGCAETVSLLSVIRVNLCYWLEFQANIHNTTFKKHPIMGQKS